MSRAKTTVAALRLSAMCAMFGTGCDEGSTVVGALQIKGIARANCDFEPAPRWVLRDKHGQRVPALVEPRCGTSSSAESADRCWPREFGASDSFPCVRVIDHAGRYINVEYDLITGQLGPCQGSYGDITKSFRENGRGVYLDPSCEGPPYFNVGSYEFEAPQFTRARELFPAAGRWWYPSEKNCVEPGEYWDWSKELMQCHTTQSSWGACLAEPVPDWVMDLLPNPPYTMAVEYD